MILCRCITSDASFIVSQLQGKFHVINNIQCKAFVDLEKAFDRVPRRVIWWALRNLGIKEWLLWLIQSIMKMTEAECGTSVMSSVWKWVFTKALAWAPYCSFRFWKPSPESFALDVFVKICMQMTWSSSLNPWRNCKIIWSSGRLTWKERDFRSTWPKPRSWYLGQHSMCFRSPTKTPVLCVSMVWWLFQLVPQAMQWYLWLSEDWSQLQV